MSSKFLRRYADLPALLYLLNEAKITFLDPATWDDQNDAHYLAMYKQKRKLASLLAVCFTQANETYHHWRVFASGPSGVCIRFRRGTLLAAVKGHAGITARAVTYAKIDQIRPRGISVNDLPFLKRSAFEDEDEFRLIYESKSKKQRTLDLPVPIACIDRILLSPWMHPSLVKHVKTTVRGISGCRTLTITRSSLISNEDWKILGDNAR